MEIAERNPSLGGRDLLRAIIERGSHLETHEPPPARDLREALRPRALDDSAYRTPVEQAHHLHQTSQDLRDLYERGATLKGDVLILPAAAHELPESTTPPLLTTLAYAQQKIAPPAQAQEFHELARTISGETADARTELTVFKVYYDRLQRDEQGKKLERQDDVGRAQAVARTLSEMRMLAQEMSRLETRASLAAEVLPTGRGSRAEHSSLSFTAAARVVDLKEEALRFPAGLALATKERLLTKTLPELDYRLERGVPREELFQAIDRRMARPDAEVMPENLREIGGFLKAYLAERLRDPETRALHTSGVFREARAAIFNTRTPVELGRVAEDFLRTNQRRAEVWQQHVNEPSNPPPPSPRPLDARERNLLFYGRAPEHHTAEMRALRIAYGLTKGEREKRVEQLRQGALEPSSSLRQLLDELATRQTVKAVNHFQASLLNEQMQQASRVALYQLHQQIPPHERTYLFAVTEQRKQDFQREAKNERETKTASTGAAGASPPISASLQEYLAAMGQIERRLLNQEVRQRMEGRNQAALPEFTITEARQLLPQPTQRDVRVRASRLAWEALVPAERSAAHPTPEADRVNATITLIQEQLQVRARVAQEARAEAPSFSGGEKEARQAALDRYAAQTRAAIYEAFTQLDEQRAALFGLRQAAPAVTERPEVTPPLSEKTDLPAPPAAARQVWHYDSLREVLAHKFGDADQLRPALGERQESSRMDDFEPTR